MGPEPGAVRPDDGSSSSRRRRRSSRSRASRDGTGSCRSSSLMGLTLVGGIFINPKLDVDAAVKDTMKKIEKTRGNIPEEQQKEIKERVEKQFAMVKSGWVRFLGRVLRSHPADLSCRCSTSGSRRPSARPRRTSRYSRDTRTARFIADPEGDRRRCGRVPAGVDRPRTTSERIAEVERRRVPRSRDDVARRSSTFMTSIDVFDIWGLVARLDHGRPDHPIVEEPRGGRGRIALAAFTCS